MVDSFAIFPNEAAASRLLTRPQSLTVFLMVTPHVGFFLGALLVGEHPRLASRKYLVFVFGPVFFALIAPVASDAITAHIFGVLRPLFLSHLVIVS